MVPGNFLLAGDHDEPAGQQDGRVFSDAFVAGVDARGGARKASQGAVSKEGYRGFLAGGKFKIKGGKLLRPLDGKVYFFCGGGVGVGAGCIENDEVYGVRLLRLDKFPVAKEKCKMGPCSGLGKPRGQGEHLGVG